MRLLDTHTGTFVWINSPSEVRYAILSHTWSSEGEQSYQDLLKIQEAHSNEDPASPGASVLDDPAVSDKIRGACVAAREDGYRLVWIDSCCIDQSSSAELSEAINSMFEWYRLASVCYAYLADVEDDDDFLAEGSQFACSRWHTRGWTLQELIAPLHVVFLSQRWHAFGTKTTLATHLERITGIDCEVLTGEAALDIVSVARRMSWAAKRQTTRPEDEAYALMGIFGVSLPTIYGEGRRAFLRLQEEILRTIPDQSILAWRSLLTPTKTLPNGGWGLLAHGPADFEHAADITPISDEDFASRLGVRDVSLLPDLYHVLTPHGVRTRFYAAHARHLEGRAAFLGCPARVGTSETKSESPYDYCAILPCQDAHARLVALPLYTPANPGTPGLLVGTCRGNYLHCAFTARTFALELADILDCQSMFAVMELCVQFAFAPAHAHAAAGKPTWACSAANWTRLALEPYPWCLSVLEKQTYSLAYTAPASPKAHERRHVHILDLRNEGHSEASDGVSIHVEFFWGKRPDGAYIVPAFRVLYHSEPSVDMPSGTRAANISHAPNAGLLLSCVCGGEAAHSHLSLIGSQEVAWGHFEIQQRCDVGAGAMRLTLAREHRLGEAPSSKFWLTIELSGAFFDGQVPPLEIEDNIVV
ncbi:HET-domain-containing protein [Lenzites betulinus]|nr:HET-domain-containing protein [Lenzites betulinus]